MEKFVLIPQQVLELSLKFKRKDSRNNFLAIYNSLLDLQGKKKNGEWFEAPSTYLNKIINNYTPYLKVLLENNVVKYYSRPEISSDNIFESINKKYYNVKHHQCIRYKFLIDTTIGVKTKIKIKDNHKKKWLEILHNSLIELGVVPKTKRDKHGRRVYHNFTNNYKTKLTNKNLWIIDSKCSQPKLIYNLLRQKSIYDKNYYEVFENKLDFYDYLCSKLKLQSRQQAKNLFGQWINGNGFLSDYQIKKLFPKVDKYIQSQKLFNYKEFSRLIQGLESKIWIDDLLQNLPCEFALPIHDSFIVKEQDVQTIYNYCVSKYNDIDFTIVKL